MKKRISIFLLFLFWFAHSNSGYCQQYIDSLKNSLHSEQNSKQKVEIYLTLCTELKSSNQESALHYAQQAFDLSKSSDNVLGELRSLNALGEILENKAEYKIAMDYAVRAKKLAENIDNKTEQCRALYTIGVIYTGLGNYEKGSEMCYECLRLSEEIEDQVMVVKTLNIIGIVHHNQNNFDKALEYYYKALTLAKEIKYLDGIAKGLNNVAAIYGTKGEYEKVVLNLRESITLNLETKNHEMVGVNYLNFGYYFQVQKQYDSALFYYRKSLDINNELNNVSSIIRAKIFLAEYYLEINDLQKSKQFAEESLEEGQNNGQKRYVYETASLLSKIYFQQNDSIKAYQYQNLELRMKDSLNIEESQTELSKLELQYELENDDQKKQVKEQRKDLINIIVLVSLIFIIVLIILLLGRMRIKARSAKLEKDKLVMNLELRNKELTVNVMSIMKKNETLSQIAIKLKGIQKEAVKDETKLAIRKISKELNRAVEEEPWQEFEMRFKQVHTEFYTKLNRKFPNLSPQEQRLCAFLRLNMTTKEISEMTGQTINAIDMARTRLRKKLGITNTQSNLINFLTQI